MSATGRDARTGRWGLITVGVAVGVAVVAVAVLALRPEPELAGIVRDPAPQVQGLQFEDVWEREEPALVDLIPEPGSVTLAYFGYLTCPDMCPMTMADIRRARQLLGDELADRTTVAFVTLDPARDDAARLNRYLALFFDANVLALTAPDEAMLDRATEQLGVRFEVEEPDEHGAYEVMHSAITYVVDPDGRVVRELPFGVSAEDIAQVVEVTLRDLS